MSSQNLKNHSRFNPLFHFIAIPLSLIALVGAIVNLVKSTDGNFYSASLIVIVIVLVLLALFLARSSALKIQDRVIRSEENFRHYVLTGKPLNNNLTLRQIIGLRFASDEELPALAKKAVDEKLSENAIKKLVKNWKGDYNRV